MGKKRSSSQIEKLSTTAAPKDDQPLTPAPKDDEKPSPPRPEEGKVEEQDDEDLSSASSSSEAEDEDEDEAEDDDEEDDSSKNATPPANSRPNPKTEDDSDSEDEEETDSDSEDEPAPKLKSLNSSSKPLDQIKSKAEPKPSAAPARSGTKRPTPDNDPKQAKKTKTGEEDNKKSGDDSKRLFQRVFNEDDEMAIIKGLYDFITKTQTDPFKYHSAFYEFVKKSIHFKVTLEQLRDKIRRLKHKYETKAKTGKTPNFSKQNDRIIFEFSQKIWGGKFNVNEAEEKGKPNGKLSQKEPAAKKPRTTKKLVLEPDSPMVVKETRKVERTDTENRGPSLALNELIRFDESVSATRETIGAMKRGMELIEESERKELARRWEKVQIAEMEVFKMRADLAVDQAMSILDALKSSSSD
ncbi:unnamed protein product [Vicia faba]|uniref:Glabrous enhancer-binding protein-like DBD domain-containing protein n=1 Tax=Vicia faba TaxID=3906 RepID=A0AAV0ZHI4_VICFA|nr:unnamed protein product [Vicia faba]